MMSENPDREQRFEELPQRNLGDLLNETFIVYGRHFWRLVGIVAVVQIPVSLVSLFLNQDATGYAVSVLLSLLAFVFVSGPVITAVGQHYASDRVDVRSCYSRVWARVLSLTMLALLFAAFSIVAVVLTLVTVGIAFFVVAPAFVAAIVYSAVAPQAVMMEKKRAVDAVRRSIQLVSGTWWRVCGILLVIGLISLGLGIIVNLPIALVTLVAEVETATFFSNILQTTGVIVVALGVSPIVIIAGTLLYYDLRVRKEQYTVRMLSREMGVIAGGGKAPGPYRPAF